MDMNSQRFRSWLLGWPRRYKRLVQVTADIVITWMALLMAFWIRLGSERLVDPLGDYLWLFVTAPLVAIPVYIRLGLYRAVLRYLGNDALLTIFRAVTVSSLLLALVVYWNHWAPAVVPRSLVLIYWWLSLLMVGGLRLLMRQYFMGDWFHVRHAMALMGRDDGFPKVAIYGAGTAGNQLAAALRAGRAMRPVA